MAKDLAKETIKYNDRDIEVIRVIFALAFNLNLKSIFDAEIKVDKKSNYSNAPDVPFYRLTIDYKSYFLVIDKKFNVAGYDGIDTAHPVELRPVSNQIKIALILINNNLVEELVKENLDIM